MVNFDRLINNSDINGLVAVLRYRPDPDLRLVAAQALGELGEVEAAEPLMRAHLEDPDPEVRAAALAALKELIGAETTLALQTYRSGPPDPEPWLVDGGLGRLLVDEEDEEEEIQEVDEVEPDAEESDDPLQLGENEVHGLIGILAGERDAAMRIKAIRALGNSRDARSVAYLAQTALYSDDPQVRRAARKALEKLYGDDTEGILAGFRPEEPDEELEETEDEELDQPEDEDVSEAPDDEDLEHIEDEEEEEEVLEEEAPQVKRLPGIPLTPASNVVQDEGVPWGWLLTAGALLVIIIVIVVLFVK